MFHNLMIDEQDELIVVENTLKQRPLIKQYHQYLSTSNLYYSFADYMNSSFERTESKGRRLGYSGLAILTVTAVFTIAAGVISSKMDFSTYTPNDDSLSEQESYNYAVGFIITAGVIAGSILGLVGYSKADTAGLQSKMLKPLLNSKTSLKQKYSLSLDFTGLTYSF
ncbi:MAG: hypothetical protein JXR91_11815 [Deltaproteobacteria bacterium]|nr:hypothetical protein [Deltaproteobacteria bacterium]